MTSIPRRKPGRVDVAAASELAGAGDVAGAAIADGRALHKTVSLASVTYQFELVACGNKKCKRCSGGPSHGPYWYAYWREGARTKKRYIGKELRGAGAAVFGAE